MRDNAKLKLRQRAISHFTAIRIVRGYLPVPLSSKSSMSRLSCFQSCLCPDYHAFKVAYVQTIVRSKLSMSRLSCVQSCLCPDYRAFNVAYVQTIVRSKSFMSRLSCVQRCLCPDFRTLIGVSRQIVNR